MRLQPNLKVSDSVLRQMWDLLAKVVNGKISFGDGIDRDNISGAWVGTTTPAIANTDFTISHNLGYIPVGYWCMSKDKATDIYTGSISATTTQITLRATAVSATVNLFII